MNAYIRILHAVVRGGSLKDEAEKALKEHLGPAGGAMIRTFDQTVISYVEKYHPLPKNTCYSVLKL